MAFFDDAKIGIPCPGCGRKTRKTISWLKRSSQFKCSCGAEIKVDSNEFRREFAKVEKATEDLHRALKRL